MRTIAVELAIMTEIVRMMRVGRTRCSIQECNFDRNDRKKQVSIMAKSPYGGRGSLNFVQYDAHMKSDYVIAVGVMLAWCNRKKKLRAGASMPTKGEQLCRRTDHQQ